MTALTVDWVATLFSFFFNPKASYLDRWQPIFWAIQSGFIAVAFGLIVERSRISFRGSSIT